MRLWYLYRDVNFASNKACLTSQGQISRTISDEAMFSLRSLLAVHADSVLPQQFHMARLPSFLQPKWVSCPSSRIRIGDNLGRRKYFSRITKLFRAISCVIFSSSCLIISTKELAIFMRRGRMGILYIFDCRLFQLQEVGRIYVGWVHSAPSVTKHVIGHPAPTTSSEVMAQRKSNRKA